MISKKFLKSSLIYSTVGALPVLSGFVLLFFYTGGILSTKTYGYLTLHLSFTLLFQSFISFCLESFIGPVIFESKDKPAELKLKIANINYYSLLFSFLTIFLFSIIGPFIFEFSFKDALPMQFYPFVFCSLITAFFNAYFKLYSNYLIYTEQPNQFLISNIVNFIATIVISLIGLYSFGDSIMGPLMGRLLSGLIIFLIAFVFMQKQFGAKSNSVFFTDIKKFCIPLLVYSVLNWVFNYADRIFIEKALTTDLVGLFDFGIKCTLGIEIIFSGMNNSVYPKIYSLIKENASAEKLKENINKYASGYLIVVILSIIFTLITVPIAVHFLIKTAYYHKALAFLGILAVGQIFKVLYYIYLAPLFYYKRTGLVAKSFVFITIVQLTFTAVLMYYFKFNGIIIAYLISKPFQILFVYIESKKFIKIPIIVMKQIVLPIVLCTFVLVLQVLIKDNEVLYYNPILGLLMLLITAIFYRNEINPFYKQFIKAKLLKHA
jgi:O-antigen/teichoic acid export membrane protein